MADSPGWADSIVGEYDRRFSSMSSSESDAEPPIPPPRKKKLLKKAAEEAEMRKAASNANPPPQPNPAVAELPAPSRPPKMNLKKTKVSLTGSDGTNLN